MKKNVRYTITVIIGALALMMAVGIGYAGNGAEHDVWKTRENLTRRLAAEGFKTENLDHEISAAEDVLGALQDMELYPGESTGFTDKSLVAFDRGLEVVQKSCNRLRVDVEELKAPVHDALKIIREMVKDEPVESMFKTLEAANLRRIGVMLAIKHSLDTVWMKVDSVLDGVYGTLGISVEQREAVGPIEDEFFELLISNIGKKSERFNVRLNTVKQHMLAKTDQTQMRSIKLVDKRRIESYVAEGNSLLAEQKISYALQCYGEEGDYGTALRMILAEIKMRKGAYVEAVQIVGSLPETKAYQAVRTRVLTLCQYALGEYHEVLRDTVRLESAGLSGGDLNRVVWVMVESALKIGRPDIGMRFAGYMEKSAPAALSVLHALARVFIQAGDDSTALAVVKKAVAIKPVTVNDRKTARRLSIMEAEVLFELGRYNEALKMFYRELNSQDMFERALSGIAWCYLKTDNFAKAEITLRKLINQAPESVAGLEGIYILAKRNLEAAVAAWRNHAAVEKEKIRIQNLLKKLSTIAVADTAAEKLHRIQTARRYLEELMEKVRNERREEYSTIDSYYQNVEKLCRFIQSHYYTGTFQESSFSEGRERILAIVDSSLSILSSSDHRMRTVSREEFSAERSQVKRIVNDGSLLSVITLVNRYHWEMEYVEWSKKTINRQNADRKNQRTSALDVDTALRAVRTRQIDSLIAYETDIDRYYSVQLIKKIGGLLSGDLRRNDRCYLEYQMAELQYRKENSNYAQEYEASDAWEAAQDADTPDSLVTLPVLDHRQSMGYYRSTITTGGDSLFVGGALYGLGWCFNDIGRFDSAYYYMRILAEQYPDNPHTPQAWMYCGEFNFDNGRLDTALAAFYRVMEYPESEWFDEALYKVAWTQYRLSNPKKAISSFLALVDLGKGDIGRSLLEKESMDYVAISFSEIDLSGEKGLRRAVAFAKKIGDRNRGCEILHRLAQVYREQGRYAIAQKTYEYILTNFQEYEKNPAVEAELLVVLEREAPVEVSLRKKYEYFKKYNRDSDWAVKQRDSVRFVADTVAARMLYDVAVSYHQIALQESFDTLYAPAVKAYRDYITMYKTTPLANECHYNLAEIQFSLGRYSQAAEDFMAVSKEYPNSKYRETAAWNAIVAAQNILKQETDGKEENR